jgi:hypothetical protein
MVEEACQERRIRHRSGDRMARSNTAPGRVFEPRCSVVLWYRIRRRGSTIRSLPLRSDRRNSCRRRGRPARYAGRPSTTAYDNTRPRRRSSRTRSKTSSLGIKLCLQVLGNGTISTSTNVLHGVILIVCIGRALRRVSYNLALRKAIGSALIAATTTLTRHLQKKTAGNPRVRKIRYISFSKI